MRSNKPVRGGFRSDLSRMKGTGPPPEKDELDDFVLFEDRSDSGAELPDFMNIAEQLDGTRGEKPLPREEVAQKGEEESRVKAVEAPKLGPLPAPLDPSEERILCELEAFPMKDLSNEEKRTLAHLKWRRETSIRVESEEIRRHKLDDFEKMFRLVERGFMEVVFEEWPWSTLSKTVDVREDPTVVDLERGLMNVQKLINVISEEVVELHQKFDGWLDSLDDLADAWKSVSGASSEARALGELKMRVPEWFRKAAEARSVMKNQDQALKRLGGQGYALDGMLKARSAQARADRMLGEVLDLDTGPTLPTEEEWR